MKKKFITAAVTLAFAASLTACGGSAASSSNASSEASKSSTSSSDTTEKSTSDESSSTSDNAVIKVGANITPHSEILEQAKPILAEKGITLEIVQIEDSITPNVGVAEGSLDANYFQHEPYLEQYNEENGTDLVSIGAIHYEPFGIYAGKTTDLSELADGATIAVPNNVTNEARALLLLQQEGILTLKDDAGINATVEDIVDNPKNVKFKELAPEQLVQSLPDVDLAVINGNYAIEGGLSVSDALAVEADDGLAATTYANIIATTPEKANDEALLTLVEVLKSDEISNYIEETYDGPVVPLK